jgi:hypothetical protein
MRRAPPTLGLIQPRKIGFPFDPAVIPRHWVNGKAVPTAMVNALHLIFPKGERFFVRSVRRYQDQISPGLREQVRGFFGQEGRHAQEHERFFAIIEAHGFSVDRFLRIYEAIAYRGIERLAPDKLSLSVTVALEHYTAILAEGAFEEGELDHFHPAVRDLLAWHAAEEIEHKAVAFDVLAEVDDSYALRMAGMALATATLIGFWALGATMLIRQERLGVREVLRQFKELRDHRSLLRTVFVRGMREYLRPDFHPWDHDNLALARDYLAGLDAA